MAINWQEVTTLAELGGNVALGALGAEGIVPANSAALASGIEASVNPLLNAIQGKAPVATDIQAGYGTLIQALTTVKSQTGLDPTLLAKIDEYLLAAQAAFSAYLVAQSGFNVALFTVAAPLAPA